MKGIKAVGSASVCTAAVTTPAHVLHSLRRWAQAGLLLAPRLPCKRLLQVLPALTSVLLQYTRARQARLGWRWPCSRPCLAGTGPPPIESVY